MFNEFHFQNSVLFLQALSCTFHVALDDGRYEFCPLLRFLFIYFLLLTLDFTKRASDNPQACQEILTERARPGRASAWSLALAVTSILQWNLDICVLPFNRPPHTLIPPRTQQEVGLACPQQNNRLRLTSVIQSCSSPRRFRDVDMNPHGRVNTSPRSNMCRKPFHMTRNMLTLNLHTAYRHGKWLLFVRWADLATEENAWKVCVSAEAELNPQNIC